jgi:DNA repair ATPase RecN
MNKTALKIITKKAEEVYRYKNFEGLKEKLSTLQISYWFLKANANLNKMVRQIQGHCVELRNQVDLRTEVLIKQVHQINESMIAKINQYEKESVASCNSKFDDYRTKLAPFMTEIDEFIIIKSKYMTQFKIDEKAVKESLASTQDHLIQVRKKYQDIEDIKSDFMKFQIEDSSFEFEQKLIGGLSNNFLC